MGVMMTLAGEACVGGVLAVGDIAVAGGGVGVVVGVVVVVVVVVVDWMD